jgi:hypothetical protein
MARTATRAKEPLPAPLPPETRTIGQLIAETIKIYGARFWPSLGVGVAPAVATITTAALPRTGQIAFSPTAGALLLSAAYVLASRVVADVDPPPRRLAVALAIGVVVFAPLPFLVTLFIVPGLAWVALVGLGVPATVNEGLGFRDAFRRGIALARADYIHVLGGLATLAILAFLTQTVLFFLLRGAGDAALWVALFLADLVISPVFFLGAALLYEDQKARHARRLAEH